MNVTTESIETVARIRPRRPIVGMSAILLPFTDSGAIDWKGLEGHIARTLDADLTPAVNMDTGYGNLIDVETKANVLRRTETIAAGREFIAGAFVADAAGDTFSADAYAAPIEQIHAHGGTPVIFQSHGLGGLTEQQIPDAYAQIAQRCPKFIGFELGQMFAPFGRIYDLATYEQIIQIPECIGAKHSSLSRSLEWQRLEIRDRVRPEFMVLTGNDLAIDMVMYGSDYLLGLSTFAPDLFAKRDAMWEVGDDGFYELNDILQYLGFFAFRSPVPAYKHNAAQFLKLRGWLACDDTHPKSTPRPDSDREILSEIAERLGVMA
jgi:dihydrodipicolinate synthase/N-acetylneuraminate lyase